MSDTVSRPEAHPEEMRAAASLRIGDAVSLQATARATPAGLIAAAVLVGVVLLPKAAGASSGPGATPATGLPAAWTRPA